MRCARGPNLPGLMCAGGMAELFKTSARAIVKLPADTEPAQVAALADAGLPPTTRSGKPSPRSARIHPPSPSAPAGWATSASSA